VVAARARNALGRAFALRTARPRHIGINLLYLVPGEVGGTEVYARELLRALAAEHEDVRFTAFTGSEAYPVLAADQWPSNVAFARVNVSAAHKQLRAAAELAALPVAEARAGVDVLHSFGTTSPPLTRSIRVVTVHDLIFKRFPGSFPALSRFGLEALVPLGARRADRVIVVSHAAKADIVRGLALDPDRVDVVYNGLGTTTVTDPPSPSDLRARWRLGEAPVAVTVAAALPHKNIERLLAAFARVEPGPDSQLPVLIVAGHPGRILDQLIGCAHRLGIADRVRFTGWLSDSDLEGLYQLASCLVYPSLLEGFGMPVLEGMHRGVPVACSNASSLPEIAGGAAELFDPLDVEAIAAAVGRVLDDGALRRSLIERGRRRAAQFTWQRAARATFASYERAWAEAGLSREKQSRAARRPAEPASPRPRPAAR
jgi:glycosyltransferase involved in cell wall biosynthesis